MYYKTLLFLLFAGRLRDKMSFCSDLVGVLYHFSAILPKYERTSFSVVIRYVLPLPGDNGGGRKYRPNGASVKDTNKLGNSVNLCDMNLRTL